MKKLSFALAALLALPLAFSCNDDKSLDLTTIDDEMLDQAVNLSEPGLANCYIVSAPGVYKFTGNIKGNGKDNEVLDVKSVSLLMEQNFAAGSVDVISFVGLAKDGIIVFKTPSKLVDGNAIIAAKDENGKILWSWHIWVCDGFDPAKSALVYKYVAGTVMDRNLGAVSNQPGKGSEGLFYQWGRKDPFDGISNKVDSDATTGTIEYAVEHPTTFICAGELNNDWFYTGDDSVDESRWVSPRSMSVGKGSSKSMYDPCPYGWRVPEAGDKGLWQTASGKSFIELEVFMDPEKWDSLNNGYFMNTVRYPLTDDPDWYPAPGVIGPGGDMLMAGEIGFCWGSNIHPQSHGGYGFMYSANSIALESTTQNAVGASVRCVIDGILHN